MSSLSQIKYELDHIERTLPGPPVAGGLVEPHLQAVVEANLATIRLTLKLARLLVAREESRLL